MPAQGRSEYTDRRKALHSKPTPLSEDKQSIPEQDEEYRDRVIVDFEMNR